MNLGKRENMKAIKKIKHSKAPAKSGTAGKQKTGRLPKGRTLRVPVSELAALGSGAASFLPGLRTVTQTLTVDADGLFCLANAAAGESLKLTQDGLYWGALKTAEGTSKMAKFAKAAPIQATASATLPIDLPGLMMSVALIGIEKKLDKIEEMSAQILSFMKNEKHSEIKGDVATLMETISKYPHNWNNAHFVASYHQQAVDIEKTARKNILFYEEAIQKELDQQVLVSTRHQTGKAKSHLETQFAYYRLSVYAYALATMLEVMLSGNFSEGSLTTAEEAIQRQALRYEHWHLKGMKHLEALSRRALGTQGMKGFGKGIDVLGDVVESTPLLGKGPVDEFLHRSGQKVSGKAHKIEDQTVRRFASMKDPGTGAFIQNLDRMNRIYNHTQSIYLDQKNIYLVSDGKTRHS